MTQQNQPTLLEQAQLTDDEIAEVGYGFAYGDDYIANAATRKAFEVVEQALREQAREYDYVETEKLTDFANHLHGQIHPEEAHDDK